MLGAARAVWEGAVAEKGGFRSRGIAVRQERVKGVVFSFPFVFIRLRIPIHGMVPPTVKVGLPTSVISHKNVPR